MFGLFSLGLQLQVGFWLRFLRKKDEYLGILIFVIWFRFLPDPTWKIKKVNMGFFLVGAR